MYYVLIPEFALNRPVPEEHYVIRHLLDHRIVGGEDEGGFLLLIDPFH